RLLAALPRKAWVVVTSDHGEQLTERREVPVGAPADTRHGHTLYQEQLHVPLIVWGPGVSPRRVHRPVSLLAIAPTLMKLASIEIPERVMGAPLAEIAGGESADRPILADSVRWGPGQQAVREGPHKRIRWHGGGWRLFELAGDVAGTELETAGNQERQALARRLEAQLPQVGLARLEPAPPLGFE